MTLINKIKFFLKKPRVIIVTGRGKETAKEAITHALKRHFIIGSEVLIGADGEESVFLLKNSKMPIVVSTHIGEYHPDKEFFAGDREDIKEATELIKILPSYGYAILNFDDETVRELKNTSIAHPMTFGFGARADIRATDIVLTQPPNYGANFKLNYDGNIVPIWLENLFGKENIYAALAAAAVGEVLGLNLVEISEAMKSCRGVQGRMRLIAGIKDSLILDDSDGTWPLSILESLDILGKIETAGRRIAVLGDILGVGKYAIEAHESIGERVKGSADLLFTVGDKAKFIAEGARVKGMAQDHIFEFSDNASAAKKLREEIKESDLILVDGSRKMNMIEVVSALIV